MKIFANRDIKQFFLVMGVILTIIFVLAEILMGIFYGRISWILLMLFVLTSVSVFAVCVWYVKKQNKIMETAVSQIEAYLDGDKNARIDCEKEGEMYRLFHSVNTLAAVLNAHAANEIQDKEFLKNTISDISHQLKTPLAALSIYNGLMQNGADEFFAEPSDCTNGNLSDCPAKAGFAEMKEFAALSEQELDRIEILVKNLLKITRLDAGSIVFEKNREDLSEIMKDIEIHFAYRTKQEKKRFVLSGEEAVCFNCDRDWMIEALSNLVKNAFDHTKAGDVISLTWKQSASFVQIKVKDTGSGIHPEDLHHIFKRFYRSRFSKDTQGIGLGLPLAKAIVEAHDGTIEVESEMGNGTTFVMNFPITTKL